MNGSINDDGTITLVKKNGSKVNLAGKMKDNSVKPGEYDMILMDIRMPVMNGYEAAKAIRGSSHPMARKIPIIALTANAFSEDVQKSLAAGMTMHLTKPIDIELLSEAVHLYVSHTSCEE